MRWTRAFRLQARRLGVWRGVRGLLRRLERQLREEGPGVLERQPVVYYHLWRGRRWPVRRLRAGRLRLAFVLKKEECRVWFVWLERRTGSTYRKRRV